MKYYRLLNEGELPVEGDELSDSPGSWHAITHDVDSPVRKNETIRRRITHFTDATTAAPVREEKPPIGK